MKTIRIDLLLLLLMPFVAVFLVTANACQPHGQSVCLSLLEAASNLPLTSLLSLPWMHGRILDLDAGSWQTASAAVHTGPRQTVVRVLTVTRTS